MSLHAQEGEKKDLELDPEKKVELDPTGKLPTANKDAMPAAETTSDGPTIEHSAVQALTKDQRDKFLAARSEATSYLRTVRLQEAIAKLNEAEQILNQPLPELENLRGAVYTKMQDYPRARVHFHKALELEKGGFHPLFNLAELDYVEKKYDKALSTFSELIVENDRLAKAAILKATKPEDKEAIRRNYGATEKLIQFKIFVSHLKLNQKEQAAKIQTFFSPYDNDCPAHYFSKAAEHFVAPFATPEEEKKNKEKAQGWIQSAKEIYGAQASEVFIDSLVEAGWIETLR
jgi:tetratricopeptide (TPR) repeat protein